MTRHSICDAEELLELVQSGDIEALDHLTRCYGERLLAVGRRHCRDADQARDAVQDALLAAGEHLDDFRGDGSVEGWLVRMVANACHRRRRGRKNDPAWHTELSEEHIPARSDATPEDEALRLELAEILSDALQSLTPRNRAILLLSETEAWTSREVADALDMTPTAVRARLSRLRRRLRGELAPIWRDVNDKDVTLSGRDGS